MDSAPLAAEAALAGQETESLSILTVREQQFLISAFKTTLQKEGAVKFDYKAIMEDMGLNTIKQAYNFSWNIKKKLFGNADPTTAAVGPTPLPVVDSAPKKRGRKPGNAQGGSNKRSRKNCEVEKEEAHFKEADAEGRNKGGGQGAEGVEAEED